MVNLPPVQFRQAGLPQVVADTLARTGLAPERLEIEVTEGVLIDDTARGKRSVRVAGARCTRFARRFRHRLFQPELSELL